MFRLDARLRPAPAAWSSTRTCSGATVAKAAMPSTTRKTIAGTLRWIHRSIEASTSARASSVPSTAGIGARSASRPPSRLPSASPAPNSSIAGDTAAADSPVTRVSRGCTKVKTASTPAKPKTVIPRPSQTCGRASTASSSASGPGAASARSRGTNAASTASAVRPMNATAQNAARQPKCRPSHAPAGTPSTVAAVSPVNMTAMAEARRSGATSPVATTEPTPKKVPCASEVTTRAAIRVA